MGQIVTTCESSMILYTQPLEVLLDFYCCSSRSRASPRLRHRGGVRLLRYDGHDGAAELRHGIGRQRHGQRKRPGECPAQLEPVGLACEWEQSQFGELGIRFERRNTRDGHRRRAA